MTTSISLCGRLSDTLETLLPKNKKEWAALTLSCATLLVSNGAAVAASLGYVGYKWATAEKLPDPNEVQSIYPLRRPSPTDLANLELHAEKISRLKKDPKVMGIAFAPNEKGILKPIYIRCVEIDDSNTNFLAQDLATDGQLGFAITRPFLESNNYLKNYWLGGRPKDYEGYGSSKKEVGKVLLHQVTNQSNYGNIGVILNKAIHQKFEKECQGRIIIDAVRNTQPYHYKLGFRSHNPEKNSFFAHYARNHQVAEGDFGSVPMYLPERAQQLWLEEVHKHPIGFDL